MVCSNSTTINEPLRGITSGSRRILPRSFGPDAFAVLACVKRADDFPVFATNISHTTLKSASASSVSLSRRDSERMRERSGACLFDDTGNSCKAVGAGKGINANEWLTFGERNRASGHGVVLRESGHEVCCSLTADSVALVPFDSRSVDR